jgi:hypothetical protein
MLLGSMKKAENANKRKTMPPIKVTEKQSNIFKNYMILRGLERADLYGLIFFGPATVRQVRQFLCILRGL